MELSVPSVNNTEADVAKKDQKKKTSKLSKGFMDFISIGEAIGYADKKVSKYVKKCHRQLIDTCTVHYMVFSSIFKH